MITQLKTSEFTSTEFCLLCFRVQSIFSFMLQIHIGIFVHSHLNYTGLSPFLSTGAVTKIKIVVQSASKQEGDFRVHYLIDQTTC